MSNDMIERKSNVLLKWKENYEKMKADNEKVEK